MKLKFKNSTLYSDQFLRRMLSWCCKQVGYPVRYLRSATFRKTKNGHAFSGLGGCRGIIIRIGLGTAYPVKSFMRCGIEHPALADEYEGLVSTTVHEIFHCLQTMKGWKLDEAACIHAEHLALAEFRQRRETLLFSWGWVKERINAPSKSAVERRADKATRDLDRWQRKLKLAQTKVRKLKAKVRYYERKQAATKAGSSHAEDSV